MIFEGLQSKKNLTRDFEVPNIVDDEIWESNRQMVESGKCT